MCANLCPSAVVALPVLLSQCQNVGNCDNQPDPHIWFCSLPQTLSVGFAIIVTLLTLRCTWPTVLKACATPTNNTAQVLVHKLLKYM